jgi:hypothetical protein
LKGGRINGVSSEVRTKVLRLVTECRGGKDRPKKIFGLVAMMMGMRRIIFLENLSDVSRTIPDVVKDLKEDVRPAARQVSVEEAQGAVESTAATESAHFESHRLS